MNGPKYTNYYCEECEKPSIKYIIQNRLKVIDGCIKCHLSNIGYEYYETDEVFLLVRDIWEWPKHIREKYNSEQELSRSFDSNEEWPELSR
tara:strand:- start:471 stop:743 length:273 start_codon:yes stop_codon:yes gene_type:complete